MSRTLVVFVLLILGSSVGAVAQKAELSFFKAVHKFPKTHEGQQLQHYYVFQNTGKAPLVFSKVEVSCSCTTVEFPKKPIAPGQKDSVLVRFDSAGKYFHQDRTIFLYTNASKKPTTLRFKVYVIPKD